MRQVKRGHDENRFDFRIELKKTLPKPLKINLRKFIQNLQTDCRQRILYHWLGQLVFTLYGLEKDNYQICTKKLFPNIAIWKIDIFRARNLPQSNILVKISHINFETLTQLNLSHCRIDNIEALNLIDMPQLKQLHLIGNNITSLKSFRKSYFKNLQTISLQDNKFLFHQITYLYGLYVGKKQDREKELRDKHEKDQDEHQENNDQTQIQRNSDDGVERENVQNEIPQYRQEEKPFFVQIDISVAMDLRELPFVNSLLKISNKPQLPEEDQD